MNRRFGYLGLGALALVGTFALGWYQVDGPGSAQPVAEARPFPLEAMDFALTDQDGAVVGPETLAGRPSLVFFGFTYCPDICPTTLSEISGWLDALGAEVAPLNVVFITVDPERDDVAAMADYLSFFHPAIRGWTGTPEQIAAAAEAFRVTFEQVPTEDGNYTMNHTTGVFLFDAAGRHRSVIDPHEPQEFAIPKIRRILDDDPETGQL